ncbi:tetratricopeptide repeat protein [Bythopirellula goksoeyrii]|uniref:Tetratricopeptide repeat protein n=1 Tax=Bythopirellula goksoeyrii TaxID=1400387 RepID=A0A5B9QE14_9BACT|nr:tetratricopeptide repeat protein [Bythopirellula goksoeyrii]QEG36049.1 tetratricopeptide repeat protein [Bythopirellula goksoeyrii]
MAQVVSTPSRTENRVYTVNLRLLLVSVIVVVLLAVAGYFWYQYRLGQTANALLTRAEQLEAEGDWNEATSYYQRYLLVEPDNTEVLVRLVQAYAQGEPDPNRLFRLNSLLYRVLGRAPERDDLRQMLAENLLKVGALEEANKEAQQLLDGTPETARSARKVMAISQIVRADVDRSLSIPESLQKLLAAADESPEDVELIAVTASSLRTHSAELPPAEGDPATRADKLMDQLVAAKSDDVEARMARYQYRQRYSLPGAEEDLQATLQLDPEHVEGLLASALRRLAGENSPEQLEEADAQLRHVIELAPEDSRGYLALASLLQQQEKTDAAVNLLRGGMKATPNSFELGLALGMLQLQTNQLEQAAATLKQLRRESSTFLARLSSERRNQLENRLRLLSARLDLAQEEPAKALAELKTIYLTEESAGQTSAEWIEAAQLLAAHHSRLGQRDQAAQYWDSLLRVLPDQVGVVEAASQSALSAGNAQVALDHIDRFLRLASPSDNLLVQRAQALLLLQLQRPPTQRNWTEFQEALDKAKSLVAERWELLFAEIDYLQASGADSRTIVALLREAEDKFAENELFWRNAAVRYHQLGAEQDQQNALARYGELAETSTEPVLLEAFLLASEKKFSEAEALLESSAQKLSPIDRLPLLRRRLEIMVADGDLKKAWQNAKELIEEYPEDTTLLALGAEISLAAEEVETAQVWEEQLARLTNQGTDAQYLKIRRLLQNYEALSPKDRQELKQTIASLRATRPKWYPVVALAARYAELTGDTLQAAEDYRLAVDLGDTRAFTLQQLVTNLYQLNRIQEAENFLAMLSADQSAASFVNAMNMELAVKQNRSDEALDLARQSVKLFPEDASRRLYLANLLLRYGQPSEAESVLREAIQDLPDDYRVWMGMVSILAQNNQVEEARQILEKLASDKSNQLQERHYLAAQGWEAIGDPQAATRQYLLALETDPTNAEIRLRYARLLARSSPRTAQGEYEQVLKLDPTSDEARREFAVLLASSGESADWARANELLKAIEGTATSNTKTNDRLRAMLLAQRGRTRSERIANCQAARKILEKQIAATTGEEADLSRLLVAQILEQEASLSEEESLLLLAQEQFRAVLEGSPPSAERLSNYIEFLLRQVNKSQPTAAADKATQASESTGSVAPESLQAKFLADAEARLIDLRRLQLEGDVGLETLIVALTAQVMKAQGDTAEAKAVVDRFVAQQTRDEAASSSPQQYLTIGRLYTLLGDHAEAETWYRRLMEVNPKAYVLVVQSLLQQDKRAEAAQVCIDLSAGNMSSEVAATLANIMTSMDETTAAELPQADEALRLALGDHQDNIELLQADAVRLASNGEYDEAIAAFTRIVQLAPENSLALNNLATLLAEKPNRRSEALEVIQRAIDLAGRQASLLDTQGTIYLKVGQADEAIASLEEATAGGVADARYYLHLAAAYHLAGREEDAQRMLSEAQAFGIEKFLLTEDDRMILEELNTSLVSEPVSTGAQL